MRPVQSWGRSTSGLNNKGGLTSASLAALLPPWVWSRSLCCIGVLVLIQNLTLIYWGALLQRACVTNQHDAGVHLSPHQQQLILRGLAAESSAARPAAEAAQPPQHESAPCPPPKPCPGAASAAEPCTCKTCPLQRPCPPAAQPQHPPASLPTVLPGKKAQMANSTFGATADGRDRHLTRFSSFEASVSRDELRLFGREVPATVRMAVGFGTVPRKKNYVFDTINKMLGLGTEKGIGKDERAEVVVVAHLADFDTAWVNTMAGDLQKEFKDIVDAGQFHALHAPEDLYPNLDICPPFCSYGDDSLRVKWRSKQNIDYAFLMYYSFPLAPYYLQIEDDILFADHWVRKILSFVDAQFPPTYRSKENTPWRLIDFSELGFIGKLFQSPDLLTMAQFLLLFYDQMPCDILLNEWMRSMTQGKSIAYWKKYPSLFGHVGVFRSLGGFQPLQERKFAKRVFDNPPGIVVYNMSVVPTYDGRFPYFSNGEPLDRSDVCDYTLSPANTKAKVKKCWFWAKTLKPHDHLTIVFDQEVPFKAVYVEFGETPHHKKDLLKNGIVQVAASGPRAPRYGPNGQIHFCGRFETIGSVAGENQFYWENGVSEPKTLPVPSVRCLRVMASQSQSEWCIIMQIQVRSQ